MQDVEKIMQNAKKGYVKCRKIYAECSVKLCWMKKKCKLDG